MLGDAGGAVSAIGGEALALAYESGRVAASLVAEAHGTGNGLVLERSAEPADEGGRHASRPARLAAGAIGSQRLRRRLTRVAMWSRPVMAWTLDITSEMLDGALSGSGTDGAQGGPTVRRRPTRT